MSRLKVIGIIAGIALGGSALAAADMWFGVYLDAHPRLATIVLLGLAVVFMGLFVLALTTRPSTGQIQGDHDA